MACHEIIREVEGLKVTVPVSTTIAQGEIVKLDGRVGVANQAATTDAATTSAITIDVIRGKGWRTNQILSTDAFATLGAAVYFDATNKYLTLTLTGNTLFGYLTAVKDSAGYIEVERA